jgi:hypothetical protein
LRKIGFLKPCAQTYPRNEKEIRCPRNKIFWEKSDLSNRPRCPRNKIFGKNLISQTVPKVPKKSDFLGKIGFLKPYPRRPRNPIFWEKSDFSNHAQGAQEIRFFGKNRISQTVCHTSEQEKEARTIAQHKLAEQLGGVRVEGKTLMAIEDKDGATTNSLKREIIIT